MFIEKHLKQLTKKTMRELRNLPLILIKRFKALEKDEQEYVLDKYDDAKLSLTTGFWLQVFGWHYAHIGRYGAQALFILSEFLYFGVLIWICDFFKYKKRILEKNEDIFAKILVEASEKTLTF